MGNIFGEGLSQHARLITLAGAQDNALPETLVVERFTGREACRRISNCPLSSARP